MFVAAVFKVFDRFLVFVSIRLGKALSLRFSTGFQRIESLIAFRFT